ncbi:GDSL-type esterase/lipase family protein [Actinoplanes sp. L3-i22]|uniref:GDSL-type esterase/lipase family protein n=1 Tax=Actinoplanes sp. L3-i22 TaxID=2836373 RepID=UPI001C845A8C|nr:GDSL-type esterase/lipase family protein [Actinoplanes sp. L3-i22]
MKSSSTAPESGGTTSARPTVDARGALRRTLTFVVALGALLGFARSGQGTLTVWVVFAIFVAAATVWVRGQYADSLDGKQWVIPYRAGKVLLGVAVLLLAFFFTPWPDLGDNGLLGICGVVLIYLVAGSALTQARQTCSVRVLGREFSARRCGVRLTVAGLVLALAGAVLLAWSTWIVGAVLLAVGVAGLIPVGMGLGSEQAIRWLCRTDDATRRLWALGGGGAVLYLGASVSAVRVSDSDWLAPVLVVLGLFVVALVSITHADVAAVMAGVALMGITPPTLPGSDTPQPTAGASNVLVALGDSYMSGEGASVFYDEGDAGRNRPRCNRAPTAWAVLITQDDRRFDGLTFLACAGARQTDVVRQVREYTDDPMHGHYRPGLVVLSLGGNDAGFAKIAEACLAPGDCTEISRIWLGMIQQVPGELDQAYAAVDRAFPGVPVVVVPYPQPIRYTGEPCDQVAFSLREQAFLHQFTDDLNQAIRATAQEHGFYYLTDMRDALVNDHLQLCDSVNGRRAGMNFLGLRSVHGHAEERFNPSNWMHTSLHPNERGHLAMRRVFRTWLSENEPELRRAARTTRIPRVADPDPVPCDLETCKEQARRWEAHQVGRRLLRGGVGLLVAGAAGGAWLMAVAFFAYRRRALAACG